MFTQESALILLRPLPAATLLRVVGIKGMLVSSFPLLVGLTVCGWKESWGRDGKVSLSN